MNKLLSSLAIVLGLSTTALAQGSAGSGSGSESTPTVVNAGSGSDSAVPSPPAVTTTDTTIPPAPEKSLTEQLKEAKDAYKAVKDAAPGEKDVAIVALIAVLMNLLLTGVKRVMKIDKGKKWLPWVALGLGLLIAVFQKFALDGSWIQAIIYGGAGPGAVIVQELLTLFRKSAPTPPAPPATTPTPA